MQKCDILQRRLQILALGTGSPDNMQTLCHLVPCVWRRCGRWVNNEKPLRPMQGGGVLLT
jgi:hypothetical protein